MRVLVLIIFIMNTSFVSDTTKVTYITDLQPINLSVARYSLEYIVDVLCDLEGFSHTPYADGKDAEGNTKYSIGYGQPWNSSEGYLSKEDAKNYVTTIVDRCEKILQKKYPLLSTSEIRVLCLSYYNVPFSKRLDNHLKTANLDGILTSLAAHNKVRVYTSEGSHLKPSEGLIKRRTKEIQLWLQLHNCL